MTVNKDEMIALLREAAELEHQLMVQYLFAAYSLKTEPDDYPVASASEAERLALRNRGWRDVILAVAREEMGHLITVQQVILSLGGRPHFDRDSFPISSQFYPFPFKLERLTTHSLAKYLWTEKPRESDTLTRDDLLKGDRAEIETEVYPHPPNELGMLYEAILEGLTLLPPDAFGTNVANQTDLSRWPGLGLLAIVDRIHDKDTAWNAIRKVVEQGEGHLSSEEESHFDRFLKLYGEFRDAVASGEEPSRDVATNPNTAQPAGAGHLLARDRANPEVGPGEARPPSTQEPQFDRFLDLYHEFRKALVDGNGPPAVAASPLAAPSGGAGHTAERHHDLKHGRITKLTTLRWARVFNKRYAVLMANLTHALTLPSAVPEGHRVTPRPPLTEPLSQEDFDKLKNGGFKNLIPGLIAKMTSRQVEQLPVENLTPKHVVDLGPDQLKGLTPEQIQALKQKAASAFGLAQIEWLNTPALDALLRDPDGVWSHDQKKVAEDALRNHEHLQMLIRWTRDEMTLVIAPIARHLTHLAITDEPGSPKAGAPFELDSTGPSLPDDEKARWCAHQRMIDETRLLTLYIEEDGDPLHLRGAIWAIDRLRADYIAEQITWATKRARSRADEIAGRLAR